MKVLLWLLLFLGDWSSALSQLWAFSELLAFARYFVGFFSCKSRGTHLTMLWYFSCLRFLRPNVGRRHSLLSSLNLTDKPILAHLSSLPVLSSTLVDCKLQRVWPCLPPSLYKTFWYPYLIPRGVGRPLPLLFQKPHLL